ncbi:MAG: FAD-dependent urate hydroxylase HpxO [Cyanobacteria bacterium P01_D01_bin.105]
MQDLKVVVIGAGIGGLTTGIALKQLGYEVEIYDRVRKLRPAGAGISLWSNGVKVMNQLGLGHEMAVIGGKMNRMEYRTHTDTPLTNIPLQPLFERVGQRPYPVSRTDLQQMLLTAFGENEVHLGMKCIRVDQDETSATAFFEDGSSATGDLVIGADGIHSVTREHVLGKKVDLRYAGYVNWNGLVPAEPTLCEPDNWVLYVGEGKRASMMPVGGDRFYFFFGVPMPQGSETAPEDRRQELAEHFVDWPEAVQSLIQALDPTQTNRLEISDIDPPERLAKGRIAILGDSAHATTPTLGQGGCQAMEDALTLARYLITTNISVEDALLRYEKARKSRTADLVLKARKRTDTIYGKNEVATQDWYAQLSEEKPEDVISALEKIIVGGPLG